MDEPASSPLRLRVLGGFELTGANGADLSPPGKKLRALIALLALAPAGGWSRERLLAMLWGDREEEQARGSLRQALAELRRSLGDAALQTDRETVAFNPGAVSIDAYEFATLAAAGECAKAGALYHGDLLDGISLPDADFADWLLVERARLHDTAIDALSRLLAAQSGEAAAATAQRFLRLEPVNEKAHRALMRYYASTGDRARALRQYQVCRDALRHEVGVQPEEETERLFKELQSASSVPTSSKHTQSSVDKTEWRDKPHASDRSGPNSVVEPMHSSALENVSKASAARRHRTEIWASLIAILTLVLVFGVSMIPRVAPLPDRLPMPALSQGVPIIVVLPFRDLTGSLSAKIDLTEVGAGIAEEFSADLSTFPDFQVISSTTSFAYANRPISEVALATHAAAVIEGSIRYRTADATQSVLSGGATKDAAYVLVKLTDGKTGISFKIADVVQDINDPVTLQNRVVGTIRNHIAGMTGIFRKEFERIAWSHKGDEITEYDYYIRGHSFSLREPNDWPHAYEQWSEGLARYPDSVLLRCKLMIYYLYSKSDVKEAQKLFDEATKLEKKSRLDEWYYLWVAAVLDSELGNHQKAVGEARAAIAMAPHDTLSHNNLAWVLYKARLYDEALEWFKFAATDPHPKRWYFSDLVDATNAAKKWPEAKHFALEQIEKNPPSLRYWYDFLRTAYSRLGEHDKAEEARKKAVATPPPPEP